MDIKQVIDERKVSGFQLATVLMGFLVIVADGLDVVIVGFIAPQLRADWGVTAQTLGIVLSAALLAQVVGAAVSGPLADRFGRRVIVLVSVLWFGLWTLAAAMVTGPNTLIPLRFVAGLGLGAALPNAITLVAEFTPHRYRSFLINLATCGFTAGAAAGGFVAAWILPTYGWRGVMVFGGAFPFILAFVLLIWLPESPGFLIARGCDQSRVRNLVRRLGVTVGETTVITLPANEDTSTGPIRTLLLPRYRFGTYMLWLAYFLILFAIYLLSSWLPTLIKDSGDYTMSEAAIAAATFQLGGPAGVLAIGWLMDRMSKPGVLAGALLAGTVAMAGIASMRVGFTGLCAAAALIGFCLNGSAVGMNALAAAFYPTAARATGVSWMTSFGRAGATISAIAGGLLLAWGWKPNSVFGVLAVPVFVCMGTMILFARRQQLPSPHFVGLEHGAPSLPGVFPIIHGKEQKP